MLELLVAIEVGLQIGALATFGLLVLGAVVGLIVIRRQGSAAWRSLNSSLRSGMPPSRDLADATVLMLAGVLLIVPGFVTDLAALLLILPFTRPIARRPLERAFRRAAADQASLRTAYVRGVQFGPGMGGPGMGGPGMSGPGMSGPGAGGTSRQSPFGPGFGRDDVIEGEVIGEEGERRG